jgi:hypothetical protein
MKVEPGAAVIFTLSQSESTVVPPVTAERSPPASRMTGADSPVIADSCSRTIYARHSPRSRERSLACVSWETKCRRGTAKSFSLRSRRRPRVSIVPRAPLGSIATTIRLISGLTIGARSCLVHSAPGTSSRISAFSSCRAKPGAAVSRTNCLKERRRKIGRIVLCRAPCDRCLRVLKQSFYKRYRPRRRGNYGHICHCQAVYRHTPIRELLPLPLSFFQRHVQLVKSMSTRPQTAIAAQACPKIAIVVKFGATSAEAGEFHVNSEQYQRVLELLLQAEGIIPNVTNRCEVDIDNTYLCTAKSSDVTILYRATKHGDNLTNITIGATVKNIQTAARVAAMACLSLDDGWVAMGTSPKALSILSEQITIIEGIMKKTYVSGGLD